MSKKFEGESSIKDLLEGSVDNIKSLVDIDVVVGSPITTESGSVIIPISKVALGFVTGGGEYSDLSERRVANHYPMAGGAASGMSITPIGFLVENEGKISYVDIEDKSGYQTIIKAINFLINKIEEKENSNEKR